MKKYFFLYNDQEETFNALTNHKAGKLIKLIFSYVNGKKPIIPKDLKPIFIPIRQQIDRNIENYKKVCKINKTNIEKRWKQPQKNTKVYDRIRTNTNRNNTNTNTKTSYKKKKLIDKPLTPEFKNKLWEELDKASAIEVAKQRRQRG